MSFRVSGKNIDVGEALRGRVDARVREAVAKFFHGGYSGHATVTREGFGFRTVCTVHLDSGATLHAEGMAADGYASADQAALQIEKRLRRYKSRLKQHHVRPSETAQAAPDLQDYVIAAPDRESDDEVTDFKPVVIAESATVLGTLSVSEAVMELDMTGLPVVAFRHAASGRLNVVYRRADGNIGWIDPPTGTTA
jgi:putative sigma-54 modulation protein